MFKSLPPQTRTIVTIIVIAVIAVVVFLVAKAISKWVRLNAEKRTAEDVVKSTDKEFSDLSNQGQTLSKPISQYQSVANTIEQLLDGCETFSSEMEVVKNIITVVKKPIDFAFLIKTFGVRKIDNCGFGTGDTQYDLITLLKDQLDSSGAYSIDVEGYKKTGFAFEAIDVLRTYFKTIGVTI